MEPDEGLVAGAAAGRHPAQRATARSRIPARGWTKAVRPRGASFIGETWTYCKRSGARRLHSAEDGQSGSIDSMSQGTLAESPAAPELSLDEWFALPEDEPGELVNGHLEEEEVPDYLHELLVALLVQLLGNWIRPQ